MFAITLSEGAQLRPLEPWQAEEFLANIDRSREHIAPWVGPAFVAKDLDDARTVLQRYADKRAKDAGGIWGIWSDGTLVGGLMLVAFSAAEGTCEVGCWLEPSAEGRGLMRRAVTTLIDWVIRERGIHRVEWTTNALNERSIALAQRLGMTLEGTLRESIPVRESLPVKDRRGDLQVWSVLATEWKSR